MTFHPRPALILRSIPTFLALLIGSSVLGQAQSPADGRTEAHAYVNTYLHFTYVWPAILRPVDPASLNLGSHPNPNESLLFAARQGDEPYGVLMLSEKLHAPWHNFEGFKDGPDFLRRIPIGWPPEAHFKVLDNRHSTTPDGLSVDEMDYTVSGEFDSGIAIQFGQYIVVFKCNAASLDDLDAMTKSILATRRTK